MKCCYHPIGYFAFMVLLQLPSYGQQAVKVRPITEELLSVEHYQEQAELWNDILHEEPARAAAWLNYYTAARNIKLLSGDEPFDLDQIVAEAKAAIPNTYEAYFINFWQSPWEERDFNDIHKAHALAPERTEILDDLILYHELEGNQDQLEYYCEQWLESGTLSPGILNWNYNSLVSVEADGLLLVQADNATFPAWVLQYAQRIRPDVQVFNLHLLAADESYRTRKFSTIGLEQSWARPASTDYLEQFASLVKHLNQNTDRPIYFSVSVDAALRKRFEDKLYLVGLAFQYSEEGLDNLALLRYNYEQSFRKEDLMRPIGFDYSHTVSNHINWNYIPALSKLYSHYQQSGETTKAKEVKQLAHLIAQRIDKEAVVSAFFPPAFPHSSTAIDWDIKALDKQMQLLPNGRYASATEVTNAEYNAFLSTLLKSRAYVLLDECRAQPVDWLGLIPAEYRDQPDEVLYENGHPEADDMPVVNISYEGAKAYCQWLTEVYNQSDYRRKKFSKVRFYLPEAAEWQSAAMGSKGGPYPWGGPKAQNLKGCYLANVNPYLNRSEEALAVSSKEPESPGEDGAYFTAPASSYFPNEYGLFNVSGNVSEMIAGGELAMGGSWLSPVEEAKVNVPRAITLPSPEVGFRVFMEVLKP